MSWYSLLILLVIEVAVYGITYYFASHYRDVMWQKFNTEARLLNDVDEQVPYAMSINNYAREQGINPQIIASIIQAESSFRPRALSNAGAYGLMQIMPDTWRQVNNEIKLCSHKGECSSECYYNGDLNIHIGTIYLNQLFQKYQGNMVVALAAYNAGPSAVQRYGGNVPYAETKVYIEGVINNWYMLQNHRMPYPTILLIKTWDKAHFIIGWCLLVTIVLSVLTIWRLVKRQSSWCWR